MQQLKTGYPHIDRPWMPWYDEKKYQSQQFNTNITDYLKKKNEHRGNLTAETYYTNKISYDELFQKSDDASRVLVGLGVNPKMRIMNLVPNIPETPQLWLGASQIGAISDFIDPRPDTMDLNANAQKVLELLKHEKSNYIIALDKCYSYMLKPIENELKDIGINQIIIISASDSMNLIGIIDYLRDVINYNMLRNIKVDSSVKKLRFYEVLYEKLKSMSEDKKNFNEACKNSPIEILKYKDLIKDCSNISFNIVKDENFINYIGHTSGTSGARPKPIPLTNKNQISSTEQLFKAEANFRVGDKILHELPFFSPLGADNNYILNLASGANNIDIPEFEISEFGYLIKKYRPNVILGTPAWIASLPKCHYLDDVDLSCVTRVIYGGDSMTAEDEELVNNWLRKHGSHAVVEKGHGMSEYCGCGSYAQGDYNRYNSIGIPLPDTIYTIVDPNIDDKLIPLKERDKNGLLCGELAVSSDAVTSGILDDEVIVKHYELDGKSYIRTRDLVKMSEDGVFSFDSRKDRSFTRFDGYKIKPYEIEQEIKKNNNVKYCSIVEYFDDKKRGLMPIAHIVLKDDVKIFNDDEYINIVQDIIYNQIVNNPVMSSRQIPAKFKFRDCMPLSKNSKVYYKGLINEGITGEEINVEVEETNLTVGKINIYTNSTSKQLKKSI